MANRSNFKSKSKSPSAFYQLLLPISDKTSKELKATVLAVIHLDVNSLSGLFFSEDQNCLFAVSVDNNQMYRMSLNGKLDCFSIPGEKQEAIALYNSKFYLADDTGNSVLFFEE